MSEKTSYAADLHIHSALSPCADDDMTPNNIVNMALLKGLDVIAVTDHNACKNAGAVMRAAEGTGLLVIAGMELETSEEIHMLCLFRTLHGAEAFEAEVHAGMPHIPLRTDIYGEQLVMDSEDEVTGRIPWLLSCASRLSAEEAIPLVAKHGGIIIPAHIDRESSGMLSSFGLIPDELGFTAVEISRRGRADKPELICQYSGKYHIVYSSDAHQLGDISEREFFIEAEHLDVDEIILSFSNKIVV